MPHRYALTALAAIALLSLVAPYAGADLYAVDNGSYLIYAFDDTVGSVANPQVYLPWPAHNASVDYDGRLLMAVEDASNDAIDRFDPDSGLFDRLFSTLPGYRIMAVEPDLGDDIYLLIHEQGLKGAREGGRDYNDHLRVLWDGAAPGDTAYALPTGGNPMDMAVRRTGPRAGNIVVLMEESESCYVFEIERTGTDEFVYYGLLADAGMMPSDAVSIALKPNGTVVVLGYYSGFHEVDEYYGYVWPFGIASGPGLSDLQIEVDGTMYVANTVFNYIERFDQYGMDTLGGPFGGMIVDIGAIAVQGSVPTPEGEDVLVEPLDGVEITYEEVTGEGTTTAVPTSTTDRVSPEGNPLPTHAELPGTRADEFTYISLATSAVYEGLIQVDVLEEGSRLFYADGVGDTFRCFTVVGSIEDARGTIPRFSEFTQTGGSRDGTDPTEVVLVEDTRALTDVTVYKFWRLELAMEVPDNMPGGDPCPWEYIEWLQKYPTDARTYYDAGQYENALSELAIMNGLIRSHAGWCIPDSSDDPLGNMVAHILAHSKTLMYSIGLESGVTFTGVEGLGSAVSLAVTSPARGQCRFALSGPVGTEVTARVYSVAGKLVATVYDGRLPEGGETLIWDGMDDTGRPIASGVYFARVESSGDVLTSKLVFIR
jgi:hypothetical protein